MFPANLVNKVSNLWLGLNLRAKLSICLVGLTVIPLLIATAITGYITERALTRLVLDHNWNAALRTADHIDRMFADKIRVLQITAAVDEIKSMIPERQLPLLKNIEGLDDDVLIVVTVDADGNSTPCAYTEVQGFLKLSGSHIPIGSYRACLMLHRIPHTSQPTSEQ